MEITYDEIYNRIIGIKKKWIRKMEDTHGCDIIVEALGKMELSTLDDAWEYDHEIEFEKVCKTLSRNVNDRESIQRNN